MAPRYSVVVYLTIYAPIYVFLRTISCYRTITFFTLFPWRRQLSTSALRRSTLHWGYFAAVGTDNSLVLKVGNSGVLPVTGPLFGNRLQPARPSLRLCHQAGWLRRVALSYRPIFSISHHIRALRDFESERYIVTTPNVISASSAISRKKTTTISFENGSRPCLSQGPPCSLDCTKSSMSPLVVSGSLLQKGFGNTSKHYLSQRPQHRLA